MMPRLTVIGAAMMLLAVMTMGPHSLAEKVDKDFLGLEKSVGLPSTTGNTWFCEILPSTMGF